MPEQQQRMSSDQPRRLRRGDVATAPRTAAMWDVIARLLPDLGTPRGGPIDVLDVGGGTGGLAVQLATMGHRVLVADPSPDALAALERRADEAGVGQLVRSVQADTSTLGEVTDAGSADLVCCHEVLEYVDDPVQALSAVGRTLRPGGALSLLVPQRSAVVIARALAGRFIEASHALDDPDGRWGPGDPLPRRFDLDRLGELVRACGLVVRQVHGVRLFSDLVPEALIEGDDVRPSLLDLERRAGQPNGVGLLSLATQLHVVAGRED